MFVRARPELAATRGLARRWPSRQARRSDSNQARSCKRSNSAKGAAHSVLREFLKESPVSTNGYPFTSAAVRERGLWAFAVQEHPRQRYWLHALLLLATLLTTSVVGAGMAESFRQGRPYDFGFDGYVQMWHDPSFLVQG